MEIKMFVIFPTSKLWSDFLCFIWMLFCCVIMFIWLSVLQVHYDLGGIYFQHGCSDPSAYVKAQEHFRKTRELLAKVYEIHTLCALSLCLFFAFRLLATATVARLLGYAFSAISSSAIFVLVWNETQWLLFILCAYVFFGVVVFLKKYFFFSKLSMNTA